MYILLVKSKTMLVVGAIGPHPSLDPPWRLYHTYLYTSHVYTQSNTT